MKIIQLEYFIEVVNQNSFTKAARTLHISQPSLTATIKKMENDLGYLLLKRTTKEISITEKGIQFYNHALEIVQQYHQTLEKMYDLKLSQTPKIKMSILESTSYWVSLLIKQHNLQNPDQHYQILDILEPQKLTQKLVNFDIHIGLSNDFIKHEDIVSIPLYKEDYVLLTPIDEYQNQKSISIKHLPLIVPNKQYQVRTHIDEYFNHLGVRPNIVMEVERFEVAANFVRQGMGYAVIPRIYYQSFNTNALNAIQIRPNMKRKIYINYSRKRQYSEQVLSFVKMCQSYWENVNMS
ncbi:LysR family transcriptional regulator [Staphylococcus canis]|uniref:LysR family transcriptional regulator n=1 Tax=Staphylococcus canis TaxID=2724942 RepID=A0ABS0TBR6_9STAP|nr:LysR family transcriptional regulator [Staphylococcus canis]MBI5975847.1 LysR family transcriptional regulator [Staphylococcus canis]